MVETQIEVDVKLPENDAFLVLIRKAIRTVGSPHLSEPALMIDVASRLGMSVANLRKIFDGHRVPYSATLEKILRAAGCAPEECARIRTLRQALARRGDRRHAADV